MNAVLAKEEYNTVWEEVKAFAVRMGRRPRILVAKMGQDGMDALCHATPYYVLLPHSIFPLHVIECYLVLQHVL